jgi:hypothetical protein
VFQDSQLVRERLLATGCFRTVTCVRCCQCCQLLSYTHPAAAAAIDAAVLLAVYSTLQAPSTAATARLTPLSRPACPAARYISATAGPSPTNLLHTMPCQPTEQQQLAAVAATGAGCCRGSLMLRCRFGWSGSCRHCCLIKT